MVVRMVMTVAALVTLALMSPSAAGAQQYPPAQAGVTCSPTTVPPGGTVRCTATGFLPGSVVTFSFAGEEAGRATADASGVATFAFTVPAALPAGAHVVEASGTGADGRPLEVSTAITVVAAAPGATPALPATGSSSALPLTRVGIVALATGALLTYAARKRRQGVAV